jgi:hypothetical protein
MVLITKALEFIVACAPTDVSLLPDTDDIAAAAKTVAGAHVFVACHISAVILEMLAHRAVVEVQQQGLECTSFGRLWAAVRGAVYVPIGTESECACPAANLSCYLDTLPVWHRINETTVILAIKSAFKQADAGVSEDGVDEDGMAF